MSPKQKWLTYFILKSLLDINAIFTIHFWGLCTSSFSKGLQQPATLLTSDSLARTINTPAQVCIAVDKLAPRGFLKPVCSLGLILITIEASHPSRTARWHSCPCFRTFSLGQQSQKRRSSKKKRVYVPLPNPKCLPCLSIMLYDRALQKISTSCGMS